MQHLKRLSAIEARAKAVDLSLRALCRSAGVTYSTVWRWRQSETLPVVNSSATVFTRLENDLSWREERLRRKRAVA